MSSEAAFMPLYVTLCLFPLIVVGKTVALCLESLYSCLFICLSHDFQLVKRVYKGIPLQLRGQTWALLLDIEKVKMDNRGKYEVSISKCGYCERDNADRRRVFVTHLSFFYAPENEAAGS